MQTFRIFIKQITHNKFLLCLFLLHIWMCAHVLYKGVIPSKKNLLIGEKYSGQLSSVLDPSIPIVSDYGYDSQFFWAMSIDPWIRNQNVIGVIDAPSYRYQRILLPLIVWVISRDITQIPFWLYTVNFLAWIWGGIVFLKLIQRWGLSKYYLFFYIFSPGLLFTVVHPMSEVLSTTLILCGLYCYDRNFYWRSAIVFALAGLARETSVLVPATIVLWNFYNEKIIFSKKSLVMLLCPMVLFLWQFYIAYHLNVFGLGGASGNFSWPVVGLLEVVGDVFLRGSKPYSLLTAIGIFCLVLWSWKQLRKPQSLVTLLVFVQSILILSSGKLVLEAIESSSRISILWLLLVAIAIQENQRKTYE